MELNNSTISVISVLSGVILIFVVPTAHEGPLLIYINERHAIRLVDALGLTLAVPGWLYINVLLFRRWRKRRSQEYYFK